MIDIATRKILGYSIKTHMRTSLIIDALVMAKSNGAKSGYVFHSDRGTQYTSATFGKWRNENNVTQSMGRIATCYDNAVAESFFGSLKTEFYFHHKHAGGLETKLDIIDWLTFYNTTSSPLNTRIPHPKPRLEHPPH